MNKVRLVQTYFFVQQTYRTVHKLIFGTYCKYHLKIIDTTLV